MCCVLSVTAPPNDLGGLSGTTVATGSAVADGNEEKQMKTTLCAGVAAAALLVGSAAPSRAMLMLQVSDGNPLDTQTIKDLTDSGTVVFNSAMGAYSINFAVGTSTPAIGTPEQAVLDLNSMDITSRSGSGGSLNFALTDTDYVSSASPITAFFNAVGGTLSGSGSSYSVKTYMDCGDAAFGTGTLLTSQSFSGPSFSGNASADAASCGHAYSLTQLISLQMPGGAQFSGDSSLAVPEPSTIALFGAGLVGLGFALRRKGRASAVAA
jgi:hypothetical protein